MNRGPLEQLIAEMREKSALVRRGNFGNERAIATLIDGWAEALALVLGPQEPMTRAKRVWGTHPDRVEMGPEWQTPEPAVLGPQPEEEAPPDWWLRIQHARMQGDADGFQKGWHAALSRIREGDALDELSELVPRPPAALGHAGSVPSDKESA